MPNTLAEFVRTKLRSGRLPLDDPLKVWAGIGSGNPCSACDKPILKSQTEYELNYYDDRPPIRLHVGCYGLWEGERHLRRYHRTSDTGQQKLIERLLKQQADDRMCDPCLAIALSVSLFDVRRAAAVVAKRVPDVTRGSGHCRTCRRETIVTMFHREARTT